MRGGGGRQGQQGRTAAPKTPKRTRVPVGQGSATKRERSLSELTGVLQGLAVVAEEKQAKRVSSGSQNEAPTYIPNPIAQPNETKRAFWELTHAKVRGIAPKQPISVAKEAKERIHETTPEQVLAMFKALAEAAKKMNLNDTNSTAYLQSSVDMGTLYLRVGSEEVRPWKTSEELHGTGEEPSAITLSKSPRGTLEKAEFGSVWTTWSTCLLMMEGIAG
jgi:hypothetical protein